MAQVTASRLQPNRAVVAGRCRRQVPKIVCYSTAAVPATVMERLKEEQLMLPLPRAVENPADDATLHNPLQRMERLSTGWFGVIMEYEGVIIEGNFEMQTEAWMQTASELGYARPLGHLFRRIKGLRDEVVVTRVFNWTQNPTMAKKISQRKNEILDQLMNGRQPAEMLEARPFLETLRKYSIPVALSCALPEAKVKDSLNKFNLSSYFDAVITAEDSGAPEIEYSYSVASQQIRRPPVRCVVVGESNNTVEAAHELGMKCVVVSGNNPVYNYVGADLVIRNLSQLSFINMKKLFGNEELVESRFSMEDNQIEEPEQNDYDDFGVEDDFDSEPAYKGAFFR